MHIETGRKSLNMIRVDDGDGDERKTNELRNEHMFQLPTKHTGKCVCMSVTLSLFAFHDAEKLNIMNFAPLF